MNDNIIKLLETGAYLLGMLAIGIYYCKKNNDFEDYALGGRKLGKWTTAISAQASDMSGWLLLGLPGAAYLGGLSASWIAIGLFIGTYCNWKFIAKRLRVYTEVVGNALTVSDYFENRFEDHTKILRVISALAIIVFFTVYTAAQFSAGAKLFALLLGVDYQIALVIGALIIISYTLLGGFMAVSMTDLIQGLLMFFALIIVPIYAVMQLGGWQETINQIQQMDEGFLKLMGVKASGGVQTTIILTNLAWGLGYFGQPHILARFMAIKKPQELKDARRIACIWVFISLIASIMVGIVGRALWDVSMIPDSEKIFMLMVDNLFPVFISGILLAAILAASMSTADSQLLVTATSVAEDFYKAFFKKNVSGKELMLVGRIAVFVISGIAIALAANPNSSVFGLVAYAWAGLGAAFGPVIIVSLFWKDMNQYGAMTGMGIGTLVVIAWEWIATLEAAPSIFQLYSIVPAMIASVISIIVVSKVTKGPSESVLKTYDAYKKMLQQH